MTKGLCNYATFTIEKLLHNSVKFHRCHFFFSCCCCCRRRRAVSAINKNNLLIQCMTIEIRLKTLGDIFICHSLQSFRVVSGKTGKKCTPNIFTCFGVIRYTLIFTCEGFSTEGWYEISYFEITVKKAIESERHRAVMVHLILLDMTFIKPFYHRSSSVSPK